MKSKLMLVNKEIIKQLEHEEAYPDCGLYHYTGLAGLEGIVSTRRLWMTHYESFDDQGEIKYAHSEAVKAIASHQSASQHSGFWSGYLKKFNDEVLLLGDYFICSFSNSATNQKLWDEYAKADGVAIKFRKEYFTVIANMNKKKQRYNHTTIQYIEYQADEFKSRLTELLTFIDRLLEANNKQLEVELAARLTTYLLTDMPKLKEKGFVDEQECRLYQYGFKQLTNNQGKKHERVYAIPQVERNGKIVLLRKFTQKDISEIILNKPCHEEKVRNMLYKNQFASVKISFRS